MKRLPFLALCLAFIAACSADAASPRERLSLDSNWRFLSGEPASVSTPASASSPTFDDQSWRRLDLPHDWSIEGIPDTNALSAGGGGFFPTGTGWYRRTLHAPESWRGRRISIEFEGVYRNAEVWINGRPLGTHPYGYTPFSHDLSPHLNFGADNTLAVRVDNSLQPNSRWYSGSGIYRHVWLHVTDPVHLVRDDLTVVTETLAANSAILRFQTSVRNDTDQAKDLFLEIVVSRTGSKTVTSRTPVRLAPNATESVVSTLTLQAPRPWSPEFPNLYRAMLRLSSGSQPLDEIVLPVGVRTIRVSPDHGFELNGRSVKLVGGNVHHDHGPLGAASFDRAEERRVEQLKAAGFNAVRTSHNPPSPAFLDACDRLGLLVVNEIFDAWAQKKVKHDYASFFREWSQRDLEAFVRRDRNHPSVVMWSIGNEMYERGSADGARIAQQLTKRIRELDSTRPITTGINGMGKNGDWTKTDPVFATLDVAGYNYELARHTADHERLPQRVIMSAESYLNEAFVNWSIIESHPYVVGDFVWSAIDYLGEAGIGKVFPPDQPSTPHWEGVHFPWHGAACGDIDLTGWRRPVSHYRNIVWDRGEKLYAAVLRPSPDGRPWNVSAWAMPPLFPSWTWPGHEGKSLVVEVYSRHDAVRLYNNGQLLGEKPTTRTEEYKTHFDVPYVPGTLKVAGLRNGKEVETFTLTTTTAPSAIRLAPDRSTLRADGQDLAFVTVEVVDARGQLQPNADQPVTYTLSGPATIAGIGSADLTARASYQSNPRAVYQGRALLVIRTTGAPGKIELTAIAPDLKSAKISLRSTRALP